MSKKYIVRFKFSDGGVCNLCLDEAYAPLTVNHFVNVIKSKVLNGSIFHRVIENFMVQAGGYKIEDNTLIEIENVSNVKGEFKSNGFENNLKHELGVISMARTQDKDSGTSQFFLCAETCPWLDGEYAAFGYCVDEESKEAILRISHVQTGRLHPYFTDFPLEPIYIDDVSIIEEKE